VVPSDVAARWVVNEASPPFIWAGVRTCTIEAALAATDIMPASAHAKTVVRRFGNMLSLLLLSQQLNRVDLVRRDDFLPSLHRIQAFAENRCLL
jgi:hypothetical protein